MVGIANYATIGVNWIFGKFWGFLTLYVIDSNSMNHMMSLCCFYVNWVLYGIDLFELGQIDHTY